MISFDGVVCVLLGDMAGGRQELTKHSWLAAEDLESIEATLELLADTRIQERIAAAADFAAGEVLDEEQVRALMDTRAQTQPE